MKKKYSNEKYNEDRRAFLSASILAGGSLFLDSVRGANLKKTDPAFEKTDSDLVNRSDEYSTEEIGGGSLIIKKMNSVVSLKEAFDALGFDPEKTDCGFVVVTADLHYKPIRPNAAQHVSERLKESAANRPQEINFGLTSKVYPTGNNEKISSFSPTAVSNEVRNPFDDLVAEVNKLPFKPSGLFVLGDLVCSMGPRFGAPALMDQAEKEFENYRKTIKIFRKDVPVFLVPGNHDTPADEKDAAFFCRKLNVSPYYSFCRYGVYFIALNGHQDGSIDGEQEAWIRSEIKKIPPDKTLIFLMHQPLGVVNERGLTVLLPDLLKNYRGDVWLWAGHLHEDRTHFYQVSSGVRLREEVHCSVDGSDQRQGFACWIYCLEQGKIKGRIRRTNRGSWLPFEDLARSCRPGSSKRGSDLKSKDLLNTSYGDLQKSEKDSTAKRNSQNEIVIKIRDLPQPFDLFDSKKPNGSVLVRGLLGQDKDKIELVRAYGGICESCCYHPREVILKMDLPSKKRAERFVLLAVLNSPVKGVSFPRRFKRHVLISSDQKKWRELDVPTPLKNWYYVFDIPQDFQEKEKLFVAVLSCGLSAYDCVGGMALLD